MYYYSNLEDYVMDVYKDIGVAHPEQINRYMIADQLNIGHYPTSGKSEALYSDGRYYIFVNRELNHRQQWQDFGHELCHVLMHEGSQKHMYPLFRELQEWKANNFMYHFCVPTFMLQRIRLPPEKQRAVSLIAETFQVEYQFAEKRLDRYINKAGLAAIHH
ncbi:Domain of uncharacterised function (DUF955) [Lysinibacillus sphaericus]|nr:Domain of uncharacterised function (DUF955) [Lysinibacillus sphaericus]